MAPPSHCHINSNNNGVHLSGTAAVPVETETVPELLRSWLLDAEEFRRQGHQVVDFIADYYANMEDYPVHPNVMPGFLRRQLPSNAPSRPKPDAFAAALRDVHDLILPGVTHWQSSRYFAHFPASSSTVGALGEALAISVSMMCSRVRDTLWCSWSGECYNRI